MKIERLKRYGSCGQLVSATDARAREDALLEALKECERAWVEGTPIEGTWAETIRQIEATR